MAEGQTLGALLAEHRRRAGMSQADLAAAIGCSVGLIGNVEGKRQAGMSAENVDAAARALKLSEADRRAMLEAAGHGLAERVSALEAQMAEVLETVRRMDRARRRPPRSGGS